MQCYAGLSPMHDSINLRESERESLYKSLQSPRSWSRPSRMEDIEVQLGAETTLSGPVVPVMGSEGEGEEVRKGIPREGFTMFLP